MGINESYLIEKCFHRLGSVKKSPDDFMQGIQSWKTFHTHFIDKNPFTGPLLPQSF